jgi:hypothetical protein
VSQSVFLTRKSVKHDVMQTRRTRTFARRSESRRSAANEGRARRCCAASKASPSRTRNQGARVFSSNTPPPRCSRRSMPLRLPRESPIPKISGTQVARSATVHGGRRDSKGSSVPVPQRTTPLRPTRASLPSARNAIDRTLSGIVARRHRVSIRFECHLGRLEHRTGLKPEQKQGDRSETRARGASTGELLKQFEERSRRGRAAQRADLQFLPGFQADRCSRPSG